jgi:hypothetical protein
MRPWAFPAQWRATPASSASNQRPGMALSPQWAPAILPRMAPEDGTCGVGIAAATDHADHGRLEPVAPKEGLDDHTQGLGKITAWIQSDFHR